MLLSVKHYSPKKETFTHNTKAYGLICKHLQPI